MARKKPKPFNPFAKGATKPKDKYRKGPPRTTAPRAVGPTVIPSAPPTLEPAKPKSAIPEGYVQPSPPTPPPNAAIPDSFIQSETETESPQTEVEDSSEIIETPEEDVSTKEVKLPPEPKIKVSTKTKSEAIETPKGPAAAAGKSRGVGLTKKQSTSTVETKSEAKPSLTDLIAASKASAVDSGLEVEGLVDESKDPILQAAKAAKLAMGEVQKSASEKAFEKRSRQMQKKRKARASSSAPKRVEKLNRRKYMEFKVDVREIMDEENVDDEHRANLLGSTWAKGERQGIDAAIEFVEEKLAEDIIPEVVAQRIIKVLKGYRKVR